MTTVAAFWLRSGRERVPYKKLVLKWQGIAREWPHRRIVGRREIDERDVLTAIAETLRVKPEARHVTIIGLTGHSERSLLYFNRYERDVIQGGACPPFNTGLA